LFKQFAKHKRGEDKGIHVFTANVSHTQLEGSAAQLVLDSTLLCEKADVRLPVTFIKGRYR
jgi:hypothetical protein